MNCIVMSRGVMIEMQALEVGATLAGSLATAFVLQRMLLEAWLRAMQHETAVRVENDTARNR
jgi:hypothetical protein